MAAPELTPDLTGNPFVEVFFDPDDLDENTARIRIYRVSEGRTWLVRGGVDIAPGVAALDWEVPFQTEASYRAELFDVDGVSLGFTDSDSVTLDVGTVWVHNPLDPTVAVELGEHALLLGTASRNIRPTVGKVIYTEDGGPGVWIGGKRRGVVSMPFGVAVESLADMDAIQSMLGGYGDDRVGVLCIRTPPPVRIPRTFFASVEEPDEQSIDVQWGGQRSNFVFTATEVKPPFPGLVTPLLTYNDLDAAYDDYDARDAAYASYTDMDRDYSLAGLAS